MSHQPAHQPVIDGFEFASAGAKQQGVWPLRDFPRLRDVLASDAGEVAYEISGVRDERGRPGLRLKVKGTLMLRCQRCLEAMAYEVDTDETLVLAADRNLLARLARAVPKVKTIAANAAELERLYDELLGTPRCRPTS